MGASDQFLVCRIGERLCALPIAHVSETMRPLAVSPLPGTEPFVLGAAVVRGETVPVVDARLLLGEPKRIRPGRLVSLRVGDRRAALAVDEVIGVRTLAPEQLETLPALLQSASTDVVAALRRLDQQLLFVLHAGKVVPPTAWEALEVSVRP